MTHDDVNNVTSIMTHDDVNNVTPIMTHDDVNNVTPTMTHDDVNNSLSHFEEKIFQTIIRLSKEVNHKRRDIDSIFDFINKSTASNITNESLEEIITDLEMKS